MEVISDSQEELFKAVKYANYLKKESLRESGEVDVDHLQNLAKENYFNYEDRDLNIVPEKKEVEECKVAFENICVSIY